ncbi:MAG TPA: response regulator [Candidatus Angelobacter sp.]|nr:response regulator [Candidatus Angelobacter sp.]
MIANRKILVVDDEHPIADTLAAILQQNGFDVYVAYSGSRAIELALLIEPDLLVSDVMMPDKNSNEVAAAVRARLPHCKTLLFSGSATAADLLKVARESGYDGDILAKPIHPSDLLVRLDDLAA